VRATVAERLHKTAGELASLVDDRRTSMLLDGVVRPLTPRADRDTRLRARASQKWTRV
jgi:hypothetical protein